MLSHIAKHLSTNDILINQQHGFRQNFSCETQHVSTINDWAKSINQRTQTDVILIDFSKAFDSVPHHRLLSKLEFYGIRGRPAYYYLLSKLEFYGIRGRPAAWIKAFLFNNRTQVVSVNGSHSNPQPVTSGVPQGSVLGPVLFLLYINDITDNINSQIRLFADDTVIYREINDQKDHLILQRDLDDLSVWADLWQLNFNITKCYHLGITNKTVPLSHNYLLNNRTISGTTSTKYLGIIINQKRPC